MTQPVRSVVTVLALALVLAACGGDDGGGGAERSRSDEDAAVTTAAADPPADTPKVTAPECPPPEIMLTDGLTECRFPAVVFDDDADAGDRVAAMATTAREYGDVGAADALADGELTVAERRQAYQDALDCMTEQGAEIVQFEEYEGLFGTEFTFIVGMGILSDAELSRISTECESQHTFVLGWADRILTGERFTERAKEILQECLAEYGVTDDVGDTMDELREIVPGQEAELDCVARAEQKPPPADLPVPPAG